MKTQKTKGFYDRENDTVHIFIPPTPTESERGGITAKEKTTESLEVTIDSATGKAYVALDKTLSKTGEAADAAVVGEKLTSMGVAIENVKEDLTSKADKTALVKTDRKLDALWKLNQGISYEFQTDDTEAYQKTVPSGAKMASVEKIGGRTLVWNQLVKHIENSAINNVSINTDEKGTFTLNGTSSAVIYLKLNDEKKSIIGHKYYISQKRYPVHSDAYIYNDGGGITLASAKSAIQTATLEKNFYLRCDSDTTFDNVVLKPIIFDLTQMFGSGNEPSTPEEFEAMFPADYYPYNAGELMSASVNEVVEQGRNLLMLNSIIGGKYNAAIGENLGLIPNASISVKDSCVVLKTSVNFNGCSLCTDIVPIGNYIFSYETIGDEVRDTIYITNESNIILQKIGNISGSTKKTYQIQINGNNQKIAISISNASPGSTVRKNISVERGSVVTEYSPYHKTSYPIPQAILNLPGYGWSAGNVRNEVNWENKKYHKRVGKVDLGTLEYCYDPNNIRFIAGLADVLTKDKNDKINCISTFYTAASGDIFDNSKETDLIIRVDENVNQIYIRNLSYADATTFKNAMSGVILYYELAEEQITDISDLIGDTLQEPIEVEAGGSLTFQNTHGANYRVPVPNTVEYTIKLSEVAK